MLVRGSLKRCIEGAAVHFALGNQILLAIIRCDRGKYYTLLTDDELMKWNDRPVKKDMRLTFRGTKGELSQFARIAPPDLFEKEAPDQRTSDH